MKPGKTSVRALVSTVLLWLAAAPAPARFEAGTFRFGAGLGFRGSAEGVTFSLGASGGYFALRGLDLGISTLFQTGGDSPTLLMFTGDARFIPLPDLTLAPYLKAAGGRLIVEGNDAWIVAAGGGLLYLFGPWYGLDLELAYRWLFYPQEVRKESYDVQLGLLLLF